MCKKLVYPPKEITNPTFGTTYPPQNKVKIKLIYSCVIKIKEGKGNRSIIFILFFKKSFDFIYSFKRISSFFKTEKFILIKKIR